MKYRQRLIIKIKELHELYNIKFSYPKTRHKDLQRLINQVYKLTKFLDNKHGTLRSLSVRIEYIENNLKSVPVCKQCTINEIKTHKSIFCSAKCQKKYFDLNETPENKLKRVTKAAKSRDYKSIHIKGNKTKKANPEIMDKYRENLNKTLSTVCDNGLTIAQNRGATFSKNATPDFLKARASSCQMTKIANGSVLRIEDRDQYSVYVKAASFKHGFETKCKKQNALLKEYGVFNSRNNKNTNGCVRDHLLSRRYGFENNIATWIISHPANCEIVLHSENIRRAFDDDNLITIEELLERIENWID
jgi:ribosomal protein L37AE/L43A